MLYNKNRHENILPVDSTKPGLIDDKNKLLSMYSFY